MLESPSWLVKSHFLGGKAHPKTSIYRGFTIAIAAMFECQRVNPTFRGLVTTTQDLQDPVICGRAAKGGTAPRCRRSNPRRSARARRSRGLSSNINGVSGR